MSRIFVTGDTHGDFTRFSGKNWKIGKDLTKADFVIICGDFGGIWLNTPDRNETYWLDWLSNKPWATLFVDGNHENFIRLNKLEQVQMFGDVVGKASDSIFHLKRGRVYVINGLKFFTMGGAKSIDKNRRIEYISWWPDEEPNWEELDFGLSNLENHGFEVDYIITHTAPTEVIKRLGNICKVSFGDKLENLNKYFEVVCYRTNFTKFWFGHFHEDENIDGIYHSLYTDIVEIK